jgi:hypothetical protein
LGEAFLGEDGFGGDLGGDLGEAFLGAPLDFVTAFLGFFVDFGGAFLGELEGFEPFSNARFCCNGVKVFQVGPPTSINLPVLGFFTFILLLDAKISL